MAKDLGITVKKHENMPEWYEQVCIKSGVAEFGDIRGTIIMRPLGYHIWECIQRYFNDTILTSFKVDNAYFPLFIPERFFVKEAEHAEGFAPELAWAATASDDGETEKAIIRPTSETIIVDSFRRWLRTYKELPIKVNQWANVVRWEVKQTKLFLRGREFLWQEGHCIYATRQECEKDVLGIIDAYEQLCRDVLAVPVLKGKKTPAERFPGAVDTYTIESLMPDGKSVQMGTSHYLGQGFMKAFGVEYMGDDEQMHYPHYNSWGVSTRLIGAAIMLHSDDKGLVLSPRLVKRKVVIIPAVDKESSAQVLEYCASLHEKLADLGCWLDNRDYSLGWRINDAELHGVPVVLVIGGREVRDGTVTVKMRDVSDKQVMDKDLLVAGLSGMLDQMHHRLFSKAQAMFTDRIVTAHTLDELQTMVGKGYMVKVYFDLSQEELMTEKTGLTARCIAQEDAAPGSCILSGNSTCTTVYFARSY